MFFGGFPFGGMGGDEDDGPFRGRGPTKEVDNSKYYELLGVDKNATKDEIKKAFRKKAIKEHPDKGGDPDKFKDITHAYDVLYDEEKRQMYDRYGEDGIKEGGAAGGGGGMDLFDLLSGRRPGGGQPKQKRTKDVLFSLKVTLEDIYKGKTAKMAVTRHRICTNCEGAGGDKAHVKTCNKCQGRGMRTQTISLGPGMYQQSTGPCDACKAEGKIIPEQYKCKTCKGETTKKEKKVLEVEVPKGAPDRHRITFFGEADEIPGYMAGDVVIELDVQEHSVFKRKGADLMMNKSVTLLEALTGFKFSMEHLDGKKVLVSSSPAEIVSPGSKKTVKELGLPLFNANYTHGNLFITFEVLFPPSGSIKAEDLAKLEDIFKAYKRESMDIDSKDLETFYTIDYCTSHHNVHQKKAGGAYDEDDEDEGHAGGQRVQCANQQAGKQQN